MTLSDVASVVMVFVALLLALPAYWVATRALFPAGAARAQRAYAESPGKAFGAGVLGVFAVGLATTILGAMPVPLMKVLALLTFGAGLGAALFGAGGLAGLIGSRLPSTGDAGSPWKALVRGGVAMELSFLIPLLGWFLLFPLSLVTGIGATILSLRAGTPSAQPVSHPEVAAGTPAPDGLPAAGGAPGPIPTANAHAAEPPVGAGAGAGVR
ncbi:MAG: hypothetical protein HYZ53_11760 [Planctomycetes bacterium]|nr:hypothetical protein [Planctomycetota bacterium]